MHGNGIKFTWIICAAVRNLRASLLNADSLFNYNVGMDNYVYA